jgi:hypothetical protein
MPQWPVWHVAAPFAGGMHTLPQAPQLARSEPWSTQAPLQAAKPELQVKPHVPSLQAGAPWLGAEQTVPQSPQLEVFVVKSTQELSQSVVGGGQFAVQLPAEHTWPASQTTLQPPQWLASDCSSTQAPLQFV